MNKENLNVDSSRIMHGVAAFMMKRGFIVALRKSAKAIRIKDNLEQKALLTFSILALMDGANRIEQIPADMEKLFENVTECKSFLEENQNIYIF